MNKKTIPSEQDQFNSIKKTLMHLKGKPLTIRTLDVGNDKKVPSIEKYLAKSPNPALGLKSYKAYISFSKNF